MTKLHTILRGRFAPACNGHFQRVREEMAAGRDVTILVTGADASRSNRLPWSAQERVDMCRAILAEFHGRVGFAMEDDRPYDRQTTPQSMLSAINHAMADDGDIDPTTGLDLEGAAYLFMTTDDLAADEAVARAVFFAADDQALKAAVPETLVDALIAFRQADWFASLAEEHRYIADYKKSWQAAPYAPTFVTVDMVIVHAGRVLLIQRGGQPGRGLWALPGGFLDGNERLKDAALRELCEETGLDLGWDDARLRLKGSQVFDDPERSARGRTVTHAYYVEFATEETPAVTGSDDAAAAQWVAIEDLASLRNLFFEDHGHILNYFLKT